jgi:hypothetical protein
MSEQDDERTREEIREKLRGKQQEFAGKADRPEEENEDEEPRPAGPPGMKTG